MIILPPHIREKQRTHPYPDFLRSLPAISRNLRFILVMISICSNNQSSFHIISFAQALSDESFQAVLSHLHFIRESTAGYPLNIKRPQTAQKMAVQASELRNLSLYVKTHKKILKFSALLNSKFLAAFETVFYNRFENDYNSTVCCSRAAGR